MIYENGRLNVDYSKAIEAILVNTATINKITEDIQYISARHQPSLRAS